MGLAGLAGLAYFMVALVWCVTVYQEEVGLMEETILILKFFVGVLSVILVFVVSALIREIKRW